MARINAYEMIKWNMITSYDSINTHSAAMLRVKRENNAPYTGPNDEGLGVGRP